MVSINPGVALGGAILGITPGAALGEKKSVRDLAANFAANKIGKFYTLIAFLISLLFVFTLHDNLAFIYFYIFMYDFPTLIDPRTAHYLVLEPKRYSSINSHQSRISTELITLSSDSNRLSSSSSSSDDNAVQNTTAGKSEIAGRRIIAGKKISALFEVRFFISFLKSFFHCMVFKLTEK